MGKRLSQITNIRVLAILVVVLGHSIILYSSTWDLYETIRCVPVLDTLKKIINIPQMLLFFALSGYLFAFTHRKKCGFFALMKNKGLRLLVPYLGIGLCFLLPIRMAIGFHSYQNLGIIDVAKKFLMSSDVGHLWYLPALFLVFLLSEIILRLVEEIPGVRKYPDIVLCIAAFMLYLEGYRVSFGYPPLQSAYTYLIWFGLGYTINIRQDLLKKIYSIAFIKWTLVVVNLVLIIWSVSGNPLRVILSILMNGLCVLNAFGVMPDKTSPLTEKIDRNSFGVYLFHSPLIYITFANIPNANPAIVIFINLVVLGAVAYGLTELVRKTRLKVLIGE